MDRKQLENFGSLITIKGTNECLGDLMYFQGHGTYDPTYGTVPVSQAEAEQHNKALSAARFKGMDENCQIGQGGYAYYQTNQITDFIGVVISTDVSKKGNSITFYRNGKKYRGQLQKGDHFNFKRVA